MQVQVLLSAPNQYNPNQIFLIGDGFGLFVYFEKFEDAHFRNSVINKPSSKPRGPRIKENYKYGECKIKQLISCEFNRNTACVELRYSDGSMISIDTIAVENEIADNMYERSDLDYLIYNDPVEYADLVLNGDPKTYLRTVTEYKPLD